MRTLCFLLLAVAAPAAAAPGAHARSCLPSAQIRSMTFTDDHEIFAKVNGTLWRNDTGKCDAIRKDRGIALQTPQTAYCSGDIVAVFQPASRFEYGSCALGAWEKVAQ